jgi:hypothetical protein
MSGITHAMAACLAGQMDWRRLTVGHVFSSPSDFYGYSARSGGTYGAISAPNDSFRGHTVKEAYNGYNPGLGIGTAQLVLSGTLLQTDVGGVMFGLANGQARYFNSSAATFATLTDATYGGAISVWDWALPSVNYGWSPSETGKVVAFGLL